MKECLLVLAALLLATTRRTCAGGLGVDFAFLAKLGTSVVFVVGSGFPLGLVGLSGGLGAVIQIGPRAGLRIDLVERAYFVGRSPLSIPSISIGVTALPARLSP